MRTVDDTSVFKRTMLNVEYAPLPNVLLTRQLFDNLRTDYLYVRDVREYITFVIDGRF
jgi:hypothetical protein